MVVKIFGQTNNLEIGTQIHYLQFGKDLKRTLHSIIQILKILKQRVGEIDREIRNNDLPPEKKDPLLVEDTDYHLQ